MWMSHSVFQHILPPPPHCGILHIQCIHDLWPYIKCYTTHIWQSWVEIKHYSVAYFDRITSTELLLRAGLIRRLIRYSYTFTARMSPALNKSFVLQCFKCGNAVEICNGFLPGTATHTLRHSSWPGQRGRSTVAEWCSGVRQSSS